MANHLEQKVRERTRRTGRAFVLCVCVCFLVNSHLPIKILLRFSFSSLSVWRLVFCHRVCVLVGWSVCVCVCLSYSVCCPAAIWDLTIQCLWVIINHFSIRISSFLLPKINCLSSNSLSSSSSSFYLPLSLSLSRPLFPYEELNGKKTKKKRIRHKKYYQSIRMAKKKQEEKE